MNKKIKCSGLIIIDKKKKVILEDRRLIKKHGEHWSFFGGIIEKGETKEQALKREIYEELKLKITKPKFFKKYSFTVKELDLTYYMFIFHLSNQLLKPHKKAGIKQFTIKQALRLRITDIDKRILKDVKKYIK